jgi:hypothetical protein
MTTQYKTKEQVKAEQASQDKPSQDANNTSIPVIEGLEGSLEMIYTHQRNKARSVVQRIKFEAWRDEFDSALEEPKIDPDFFTNLSKNYSPIALNHMPMLLSIPSSLAESKPDQEIETLTARFDELVTLEQSSEISDELLTELDEVEARLKELGVLKR